MTTALYTGGRPLGAGVCDATATDSTLVEIVATYRRRVAGAYRALRADEIEALPPGPLHVSTKIDGELWFLARWNGVQLLLNPRGSVIAGAIPLLLQAPSLPDDTVLAGELHASVDGRRARVGDLAAVMGGGAKAELDRMAFAAFDVVVDAGEQVRRLYAARLERLMALLPEAGAVRVLPSTVIGTAADVRARFAEEVESGNAEGLIVRLDSGMTYKLKPSIHLDTVILGYTTRADAPAIARSILVGVMHDDGRVQVVGSCGNLGSDEERRALHATMAPLATTSTVRVASESGGLYTFIKPELVAELCVTDLQGERSDGSASTTQTLSFGDGGWRVEGMAPCARPLHSVLERLRPDKSVTPSAVRFAQVEPFMSRQTGSAPAVAAELPVSMLLIRRVWTKETKGVVAVRKLLVWRTNKAQVTAAYPAYVVHWTDYSPGRASPLDREVRLARDEASANAIAEELIAANVKKGWSEVGGPEG